MNPRIGLPVSALLLAGAMTLTGCAAFDSIVHKQATSTFDDVAAFEDEAEVDAGWVPADATAITLRTSTIEDAPDAVVLLTSETALGEDCVEVERQSAPAWVLDDAPDPYAAKTVFACGEWSVMETADGWFGWTPNSEAERSAAALRG